MYFDYTIKINIKIIIKVIIILEKQIVMLSKYVLLILAHNLYAINFLRSINFDFLNYSFNSFIKIRIVFIKFYNINQDYNKMTISKANQIKTLYRYRLIKISYSKTSNDLRY